MNIFWNDPFDDKRAWSLAVACSVLFLLDGVGEGGLGLEFN
jgi:hypothetical protein